MRILITLALFAFLSEFGAAQTSATGTEHQYPHSEVGLQAQFRDILDAYRNGSSSLATALAGLQIDDDWFAQYFLKDDAERLSREYQGAFDKYKVAIERNLQRYDPSRELTITVGRVTETPCSGSSQTSVFPSGVVVAEPFKIVYRSKGEGSSEWVSTLVYQNGRFRLLGGGIFPFWVDPGPVFVSRTAPKEPTKHCPISEIYKRLALSHW